MRAGRAEVAPGGASAYRAAMRTVPALLLALALGAGCGPSPERPDPDPDEDLPGRYLGRQPATLTPTSEAESMVRPTRAREQQVELLYQALGLSPGKTACEVGAGNGFHTLELARQVYPGGRVFAVDVQPEMLAALAARESETRAAGGAMAPIERVAGEAGDAKLPAEVCDLVLIADTWHEVAEPAALLASVRAGLKVDGRIAVVEPRSEDPAVAGERTRKMSKAQLHREFTANGFILVGQLDALPQRHALFFGRDDGPRGAVTLRAWRPRGEPNPATENLEPAPVERPIDSGDVE